MAVAMELTTRSLDTIADEIRWHEEQAQSKAASAIQHKIEIGKRLLEAKEQLPHGVVAWGFKEFGWSQMHLWRHMELARNQTRVFELGNVSMRAALEAIAPPRPELPVFDERSPEIPSRKYAEPHHGIAHCSTCGNLYDGENFTDYCPYCRKQELGVTGWVDREVLDRPPAHVSYNSGNNEWYTPAEYIEAARRVMGDIDLDPASSNIANETVRASSYFTAENDGLLQEWLGRVWMNPPYAAELIGKFTDKLAQHFSVGDVIEAIVLVNNATETNWFQGLLTRASAVCFVKQRVRFIDMAGNPSGAPLQGQAVLYLGGKPALFANEFSQFGTVLYGRRAAWCNPK